MHGSMFHEGERAVQRRAGVEDLARRIGSSALREEVPPDFAAFLSEQRLLVVASRDLHQRVWASPLIGPPGFARVIGTQEVFISARPHPDDPLGDALQQRDAKIGLLALEAETRSRIRLNGTATPVNGGIVMRVEEAFGNCTKFIQRRVVLEAAPTPPTAKLLTTAITVGQRELIESNDTFFIASAHPERGADASHRGGQPGFVEIDSSGRRARFPDYSGNNMFQTLGNLTVDSHAGLLFLDWDSGDAIQLSGRAEIVWSATELAEYPGAQRLIDVEVDLVRQYSGAIPAPWQLIEHHRLNPPTRAHSGR